MAMGTGIPAALLNVLVTANTAGAQAQLAALDRKLMGTAATAQKSSASTSTAIGKGMARGVGALAAVGGASIVAAAKFEDAFADVRKTVDATEPQFKRMEQGIRNLAKEVPISVTELSELAGQAGALGVAAKNIIGFTKVAAQLGTATDLSAGDAANALARLGNILGQKTVKDFERMGATLVDLGNKGASTEAEISEMSLRIARSGGIVGLSSKQVLGLAASLSNLGIKAESGGTAVSRALLTMSEAIKAGGAELDTFAQVAGMTTEKFGKLFAKDAPTALGLFAEGLVKMNDAGKPLLPTLAKVELNEIRVRDALLGLGQAQGEVNRGQEIANKAWGQNSALVEEANKKYKTTASQFELLKNRIFDVGITLGQKLLPEVNRVMERLGKGDIGGAVAAFAELGAKMGAQLAGGLVKGFWEADILGKLFIAGGVARLLMGRGKGGALFKTLGSSAGKAWGLAFVAALLTMELGNQIKQIIEGHKLDQSTREAFSKQLGELGLDTKGFIGNNKVRVATAFGELIFNSETNKVVAAQGKKLQGLLGQTAKQAANALGRLNEKGGLGFNAEALKANFRDVELAYQMSMNKIVAMSFTKWGKASGITAKETNRIRDLIAKNTDASRAAAGRNFDKMVAKIRSAMDAGVLGVRRGTAAITDILVAKMAALGLNTKDLGTVWNDAYPSGKIPKLQPLPKNQTGAMLVPGSGSGDKVTVGARVEPGEALAVLNRNAAKAWMGWNEQHPRFQGGGMWPVSQGRSPGIVDDMAARANNIYGTVAAAIYKRLKASGGIGSASWGAIDALANKLGLARGTLTGRIGQPNSRHGIMGPGGRALATDYSGAIFGSTRGPMAEFTRKLIPLAQKGSVNELFYDPLGGWDSGSSIGAIGNHDDHVHVALQKGGMVKAHKPWREVFGSRFDKNELTTLAKFVGMRNPALMAAIAMGESSGSPGIIGDGGDSVGLWQINKPSWGGTNHSLSNPINNAMVAKKVLQQQGLDAWTIYNTGAYRAHLGGRVDRGKLELLRGTAEKASKARPGFVPSAQEDSLPKKRTTALRKAGWDYRGKGKFGPGWYAPKKKGGGAGGEAGVADDPFAAINELIGEQNLLKMQNFQLGMAQHPVLGIPNPASPTLGAMMSASSGDAFSSAFGPGATSIATQGNKQAAQSLHQPIRRASGRRKASQSLYQPVILIEDGAVDARRIRNLSGKEARRAIKRAGRRANRRLPSGGGGGP